MGAFDDLIPAAAQPTVGRQGGTGPSPEQRGMAQGKIASARMARRQLEDLDKQYNANFRGAPRGLGGLTEYAPDFASPTNAQFNATAAGMLPFIKQMTRTPGSGADSDKEQEMLLKLLPDSAAPDAANAQRIRQLKAMIGDIERQYAPIAGYAPPPAAPAARKPMPKAKTPAQPKVVRWEDM